jgi:L-aspartate oxidase
MDGTAAADVAALAADRELVPARLVTGVKAAFIGADGRLTPGMITARAVVIAAGGLGQVFATTSNPAGATGDGIAIAARAGAALRDLEFVQFHPTVLWLPGASGQCPLITEALRGAGAVLRDLDGTPLMAGHDPRGDLAPRDVVAARMAEVIEAGVIGAGVIRAGAGETGAGETGAGETGAGGHVWLDATGLGREELENGFPTVTAACRKHGIDPVTDYIPVAPGAHYSCGGILADLDGRTTLPGLYAVGEAASTGVQGANRLASNSVTEAVIAGRRAGAAIAGALSFPESAGATVAEVPAELVDAAGEEGAGEEGAGEEGARELERQGSGGAGARREHRDGTAGQGAPGRRELAAAMSRWAGVMRDGEGLSRLVGLLDEVESGGVAGEAATVLDRGDFDLEAVEEANLRLVSWLIAVGARRRAESRGCHRRRDATGTAERAWHTVLRLDGKRLVVREEEL